MAIDARGKMRYIECVTAVRGNKGKTDMDALDIEQNPKNRIDIPKRDRKRLVLGILSAMIAAVVSSLALHVFVYPANFVPLGMEAVATILQKVFKINAGYFTLILNVPLVIAAWFKLNKKYVAYTLLFTVLSSALLIVWEKAGMPQYKNANERLLAAIFAGILLGARTGIMMRIGASSGGVDIIANMVQAKKPHVHPERVITYLCCGIIACSYFVYKDFECILLAVVQMFISEKATALSLKGSRMAIEVKIVTKHVEEIRKDIILNLRHGATLVDGKGMFTLEENTLILSVINVGQLAELTELLKKYPDTFAYYSEVNGVNGNFRWRKDELVK